MFQCFYPNEYLNSSYEIDYEELYRMGVRGVLFDIDNTLVPHGAPATADTVALFERIRKAGLKTCLISNNKVPRVKPLAEAVGSEFLADAHKPSGTGYKKACHKMGLSVEECIFVGDQIFTDIFGANRAGMRNILVRPIHPKEEIQIVLKRKLENIVLFFYQKNKNKRSEAIFSNTYRKNS